MSTPTCSFISNGNATTLTNYSLYNLLAPGQPKGVWYYFLIKNDGSTNTLSNISLSSGFTWYMCLAANGGSGGPQSKQSSSSGGGGGGGQVLNVKLDTSITNIPITQIVLQPISADTKNLTSFTCNSSFTTTNSSQGITFEAGTYYLYPGTQGGSGSDSGIPSYGGGGAGGSANNPNPTPDIGVIGAAGGGGSTPGYYYTGYLNNTQQTSYSKFSTPFAEYTPASSVGGNVAINFPDGLTGAVSIGGQRPNGSGKPGSAGNGAFAMFYCTHNP